MTDTETHAPTTDPAREAEVAPGAARCAIIDHDTGVVVNVVLADPASFDPGLGMLLLELAADARVQAGDLYTPGAATEFAAPEPELAEPPTTATAATVEELAAELTVLTTRAAEVLALIETLTGSAEGGSAE